LEFSNVRGAWATHKPDYRGNFAPQVPRNVILSYSNEGDLVLDPMVGGGTTLIEARLLKSKCNWLRRKSKCCKNYFGKNKF
jgi:hypothetical protein